MNDRMDDWMKQLVPHLDPAQAGETEGPCPDANLLAALGADTLLPEEREAVIAHLAVCAPCRSLAVISEEQESQATDAPSRLVPFLLMAAIVVLAVTLVFRSGSPAGPPTMEERLLATVQDLQEQVPELLGDLQLVDIQDHSTLPEIQRGDGLELHTPIGAILDPRPTFRWQRLVGASSYSLTLRTGEGTLAWRRECQTTELAQPDGEPDLVAGSYVWEVSASGLRGEERTSQSFRVLAKEDTDRYRAALQALAGADEELRDLLSVHLALQAGLLEEAERHARAHLETHPETELARATLQYVLRAMGSPEADSALDPSPDEH